MEKHLHIIGLTVPYPADYGGVIDLFWKLPALQQQGIQIHLHCFDYGRGQQKELEKYCVEVNYYPRKKVAFSSLPHIVATRKNKQLLQRLLQDEYPILMEGIHCTHLLNDKRFINRKKFVRLHNVEHEYYQHLYESASSFFKQLFFARESNLLKRYELSIAEKATVFFSVTESDADTYKRKFGCKNIQHLPLFLPNDWQVNIKEGMGNYCLYQGDLSVAANEKAVLWLLESFKGLNNIPLVIAGKNPSQKLAEKIGQQKHISLVANPASQQLEELIADAQINILPSFSSSGIKLKLLNALYNGRHCIANNETLAGSGLDELCHVANDAATIQQKVLQLFAQLFSAEVSIARKEKLYGMFNNEHNAQKMVQAIWG